MEKIKTCAASFTLEDFGRAVVEVRDIRLKRIAVKFRPVKIRDYVYRNLWMSWNPFTTSLGLGFFDLSKSWYSHPHIKKSGGFSRSASFCISNTQVRGITGLLEAGEYQKAVLQGLVAVSTYTENDAYIILPGSEHARCYSCACWLTTDHPPPDEELDGVAVRGRQRCGFCTRLACADCLTFPAWGGMTLCDKCKHVVVIDGIEYISHTTEIQKCRGCERIYQTRTHNRTTEATSDLCVVCIAHCRSCNVEIPRGSGLLGLCHTCHEDYSRTCQDCGIGFVIPRDRASTPEGDTCSGCRFYCRYCGVTKRRSLHPDNGKNICTECNVPVECILCHELLSRDSSRYYRQILKHCICVNCYTRSSPCKSCQDRRYFTEFSPDKRTASGLSLTCNTCKTANKEGKQRE